MKKLSCEKATLVLMAMLALFSCKKEVSLIQIPDNTTISNVADVTAFVGPVYTQLATDSATNAIFLYNTTKGQYLTGNRGWQGCAVIGFEHDHLFAAWYAGVAGEEPGNYITVAESDDKGKTWKTDVFTVAPNLPANRQIDPSFWNDKYGNLHLSWTTSVGMWDGGVGGIWNVLIRYQNNHVEITKPTRLFGGLMNVKPISINNGATMLFTASGPGLGTLWGTYTITPTLASLNGPSVYTANYDEAKQILLSPVLLAKIPVILTNRYYDEHMVVDVDGTNYLCMMREIDGMFMSKSSNAGATWTVPVKFTDVGATVSSRSFFGKLKSGNILLVLNNSIYREKMTAYLSKDNGKTWPYKILIDGRAGCSYPDVTQDADGKINVIFDYGRSPNGEIDFASFTEQSIIDGVNPTFSVITKIK